MSTLPCLPPSLFFKPPATATISSFHHHLAAMLTALGMFMMFQVSMLKCFDNIDTHHFKTLCFSGVLLIITGFLFGPMPSFKENIDAAIESATQRLGF